MKYASLYTGDLSVQIVARTITKGKLPAQSLFALAKLSLKVYKECNNDCKRLYCSELFCTYVLNLKGYLTKIASFLVIKQQKQRPLPIILPEY